MTEPMRWPAELDEQLAEINKVIKRSLEGWIRCSMDPVTRAYVTPKQMELGHMIRDHEKARILAYLQWREDVGHERALSEVVVGIHRQPVVDWPTKVRPPPRIVS